MYKQFHSVYLFPSVASSETHIFPSLDDGYHICLQAKDAGSLAQGSIYMVAT